MSAKLGQSLDEILKDQRKTRGPRGARAARRGGKSTTKVVAPAGGVKKNTNKPAVKNGKQAPARGAKGGPTGSIIQMSNLVSSNTNPFIFASWIGSILTSTSPGMSLKPRSRYVIDEAVPAWGPCIGTYLPSRILST